MDVFFIRVAVSKLRDFATCHDDFELKPPDGILQPYTFKWLGFVYYIHVTTALPHQSVSPRVVLIHKQFVLGTASDLLQLPKNYKLGNIIFGEYERDEDECGLTRAQVKMDIKCPRAYFVIPYQEVIPHPEYTRFGIANSLAVVKLMRPIKSFYMLPICLPTLIERRIKRRERYVFMVDYLSAVPLDIDAESMAKKTLRLYPHKDCRRQNIKRKFGTEGISHALCTSGCGIRPGAPIVSHDTDGPFQLIGLSAGSELCTRHIMRSRLNEAPPLFIDVYPYVTWIMNVISASVVPRSFPGNFMLVEGGTSLGIRTSFRTKQKIQKYGWRGRTFVSGNYCYMSPKRQRRTAFFYYERFAVTAGPSATITVFIKISAGIECTITCARLLVPNHKSTPIIDGVGGFNVSVQLDSKWFPHRFYFTLGLNGKNSTAENINRWWAERGDGLWSKIFWMNITLPALCGMGYLGILLTTPSVVILGIFREATGYSTKFASAPQYCYVIGPVVFGDYERDEGECRLSQMDIKKGLICSPAYFETLIVSVETHPEYKRFGVKNTLALAKLARPLKSEIPIHLETEKMAKKTVKLYQHRDCRRFRIKEKPNSTDDLSNTLCTTGCGVRSGAVIVSHDADGLFEIIGISVGSPPCKKRQMRTRLNRESPLYIDVYPYITWITNVVTANTLPNPYLANYALAESGLGQNQIKNMIQKRNGQKYVWRGRTFVMGNGCFRNPKRQKKMAFFYYEAFKVYTQSPARLRIYMKISAGIECTITCARLLFPNRSKSIPLIDGIGGFNISVQMETKWFPDTFHFTLRLNGKNSTSKNIDLWWSQRGPGL
ncbi:uncharacterized protein [Battus philenor]|uniref:uncharacterized protein n=1 Tax=Battus philenor TaxID=42288 RepID=UPI0035D0FB1B